MRVEPSNTPDPDPAVEASPTIASGERGFVPILAYHHVRKGRHSDTAEADREYIVPPAKLEEQLKWLNESGYSSITSEQMYQFLVNGQPLPPKPIILTFDDNEDNQYTHAAPLLREHGLGRPSLS